MEAIREPITRLVDSLQWFAAVPELRLLHVVTSNELRLSVLQQIAAHEHLPGNRAPYFILETPYEPDANGWDDRALELRADMDELRDLLAKAERPVALPPMPDAARGPTGMAAFAVDLRAAVDCLTPHLEGIVTVLAPVWVNEPQGWVRDLDRLLARPELAQVRFVVVDIGEPLAQPISDRLGALAEQVDARIDRRRFDAEMRAQLANMKDASAATGGMAMGGFPGPKGVVPPPRPRAAAPAGPEQLAKAAAEAGVPVAVLDPAKMQQIRVAILGAAHAASEKRFDAAVQHQLEARDLCGEHGLFEQVVTMEVMLGSYMLQAGRPDLALDVFARAVEEAKRRGFGQLAVQAQMAKGSAYFLLKRELDAITAYAEAGRLGAELDAPILAIEGYRVAGQYLAQRGDVGGAAKAFQRALDLAHELPPEDRATTTAAEAARKLAALCRKHGRTIEADYLNALAADLESPPASVEPTPAGVAPQAPRVSTTEEVS
jgi:tetratricopeptide (TPR) repeat protein